MRRYLLDTGSAADFIYRRLDMPARVQQAALRGNRVGTATPVVGELYAGVELSHTRERNLQRLIHGLSKLIYGPSTHRSHRNTDGSLPCSSAEGD